ncbi:MAG TPA: branched-chain amino acid ABC transporter substrate-binding protein [Candidatus Limnocylindria bacterium]|jgi:branched-chain amino acid transport system substrate-binding protein
MVKHLRWTALFAILALVLAACTGDGGTEPSTAASAAQSVGEDPTAVCDADEFGCAEIAPGADITLGTALVITTADADLGQDSQYGAVVAGNLRNEDGGIRGHNIAWDHQDDQCSAEGGTTAARALVADPTIVAVIGTSCSSAGVPAAQITSEAGVLMVSPSNTAPSLTHPDTHEPFYARTAHNDEVQGAAMATFACEELGVTRAATVHDGSPYSEQLQQVFADEFEAMCGEITTQEAVAPTDTDFRTVLTTIAATDPELIYYPIFTQGGALMTQQARENADLEGVDLAGADGMQSQTFLETAGEAGDGVYTSGPDLAFESSVYADTFLPAYYEVCNCDQTLSVFHAHAFDAANMIFDAIDAVALEGDDGTLYIPRTALRDAFFGTSNYEGITGTLTCDETGDCADPKISVSLIGDGSYERIWPEE